MLTLSACASSSGVYRVGEGTYRITSSAWTSMGGEGTAKASAIRAANDACAKEHLKAIIVDEGKDAQFTGATVDVTFKCAP
jgi:hypothetical protein